MNRNPNRFDNSFRIGDLENFCTTAHPGDIHLKNLRAHEHVVVAPINFRSLLILSTAPNAHGAILLSHGSYQMREHGFTTVPQNLNLYFRARENRVASNYENSPYAWRNEIELIPARKNYRHYKDLNEANPSRTVEFFDSLYFYEHKKSGRRVIDYTLNHLEYAPYVAPSKTWDIIMVQPGKSALLSDVFQAQKIFNRSWKTLYSAACRVPLQ